MWQDCHRWPHPAVMAWTPYRVARYPLLCLSLPSPPFGLSENARFPLKKGLPLEAPRSWASCPQSVAKCSGTVFVGFCEWCWGFMGGPHPSCYGAHGMSLGYTRSSSASGFFFLNMFIYLIFKSRTPVLGYFQLNLNFASRHHGRPRAAPGAPRMRMCENHSTVHREHGKGNECLLPRLLDT